MSINQELRTEGYCPSILNSQISIYSKLILKPKPLNSCSNTFSDSGMPGAGIGSP